MPVRLPQALRLPAAADPAALALDRLAVNGTAEAPRLPLLHADRNAMSSRQILDLPLLRAWTATGSMGGVTGFGGVRARAGTSPSECRLAVQ